MKELKEKLDHKDAIEVSKRILEEIETEGCKISYDCEEREALRLVIEAAEWKECYRNCYIQSEIKRYHDEMVKEYGLEGTPSDTALAKTEEGEKE